ncbi:MAG: thermonuclease family protein [Thermodesulfobacteriota bacterium]
MSVRSVAVWLFLICGWFSVQASAAEWTVIRVYDGDTLKAEGYGVEIKVRLAGIDAPETGKGKRNPGQPYGEKARQFLSRMVLNQKVVLDGYGIEPYNRQLAVVSIAGNIVNLELVRGGLAEVYRGRPPRGFDLGPYQAAEREASHARRGIWSLSPGQYTSPRDWRKTHSRNSR